MNGTVLVSTHDLTLAGQLRDVFEAGGYVVGLVTDPGDVASAEEPVLLVLTGGLETDRATRLAEEARALGGIPVFGVFEDDEHWRRTARHLGLADSFLTPVDPDEVLLLGSRLIERKRLQRLTGIVGETDLMREALERVVQIAPVASTVLVTGESGTGKELVARGIHALSPRRYKPFIAVNVAALSETLLESELFGHEKGAFTGAIDSRRGLFELADGGTIFLDEIGEMPLTTQTKLLRVLEQREFLRVGGERPIRVDVRIIAATNQDLRQLVAISDFRRDLYFRLNVLHIELPPLRERREDIPLLVDAFIHEVSAHHERPFVGISPEAMEILERYHWPGNVRELRNLVESMVVLAPGRVIGPDDIPADVRRPGGSRALLPTVVPPGGGRGGVEREGSLRPELQFIFRTLVELRVDMDELRRQFDRYREELERMELRALPPGPSPAAIRVGTMERGLPAEPAEVVHPSEIESVPPGRLGPMERPSGAAPSGVLGRGRVGAEGTGASDERSVAAESLVPDRTDGPEAEGVVVYRPGMTMEDLEREAIRAALVEVGGNRRLAAERLGIGERTLYRKIKKFELDG